MEYDLSNKIKITIRQFNNFIMGHKNTLIFLEWLKWIDVNEIIW